MEPIVAEYSLEVNGEICDDQPEGEAIVSMKTPEKSLIYSQSYNKAQSGMNPFEVFREVRKLFPQAFFFQSCSTPESQPELTVLGLEAEEILSIRGGQIEALVGGKLRQIPGGSLGILEETLKSYYRPSGSSSGDRKIPFEEGGAFGGLGYDIVREMEPRLQKQGYFSSLPGSSELDAEILFVKNLIVFDHKEFQVHLILKSKSGSGIAHKDRLFHLLNQACLQSALPPLTAPVLRQTAPCSLRASLGRERFKTAGLKLKNHIRDGDIFQAVLAERFECEISAAGFDIFSCLRQINPAAYSFYFQFQSSEFFGASPEALIKIKDGRIETHPIAGTRPRGKNPSEDLQQERELIQSAKESAEHLMLVDLARNDIGRVAVPGTVEVKTFRQVMRLPNVMHLISKVEGQLQQKYSDFDALKACFPAGTLSGAPKIRAMEILAQLEAGPRGLYGGAVVAFDFQGGMDSCIAIRAMEVSQGLAILRAGAGIVADSELESEYQEIEHKLATLRQALALAESFLTKKREMPDDSFDR
jgi:anthranilate synthase component 1